MQVWIVGGTHGNEYNGVLCATRWASHPDMLLQGVETTGVSKQLADLIEVQFLSKRIEHVNLARMHGASKSRKMRFERYYNPR